MKFRIAIILLVVIAAAGAWALFGKGGAPDHLVPAWQLLDSKQYIGEKVMDPFVSWASDSKSLLFSQRHKVSQLDVIYRWKIGAKKLDRITEGASPNYLDDGRSFIYLHASPKALFRYDLASGKSAEMVPSIKTSEFWKQATSVRYDLQAKALILRITDFTPRPSMSGEIYDLKGKQIGQEERPDDVEVTEYCKPVNGGRCAFVVQKGEDGPQTLEIGAKGQKRRDYTDSGNIGSVAWSPDGKVLAYGYGTELRVLLDNGKRSTIGRFGIATGYLEDPYVGRLIWSPDGRYLAALVITPNIYSDQPRIFILDMSSIVRQAK